MQPTPFPVRRRSFSVASTLMLLALCLTLFSPFGVPLTRAATVISPTDGATTSLRPVFFGTATANTSIRVANVTTGSDLCTASADATGNWSCQASSDLTSGSTYSIQIFEGATPSVSLSITANSAIPNAPVIDSPVADPTDIAFTWADGGSSPARLEIFDVTNMTTAVCFAVFDPMPMKWTMCSPSPALGVGSYLLTDVYPSGREAQQL